MFNDVILGFPGNKRSKFLTIFEHFIDQTTNQVIKNNTINTFFDDENN